MIAFEVLCNDETVSVAGAPDVYALFCSVDLMGSLGQTSTLAPMAVADDSLAVAHMSLSGSARNPDEREKRRWVALHYLAVNDRLVVRVLDTQEVTLPLARSADLDEGKVVLIKDRVHTLCMGLRINDEGGNAPGRVSGRPGLQGQIKTDLKSQYLTADDMPQLQP